MAVLVDERTLVTKLRRASQEATDWDHDINPPLTEWSGLLENAANMIEELLDDMAVPPRRSGRPAGAFIRAGARIG
jgi:hypothetical protein